MLSREKPRDRCTGLKAARISSNPLNSLLYPVEAVFCYWAINHVIVAPALWLLG